VGAPRPLPSRHHIARRPRRRIAVILRRHPIVFWVLTSLAAGSTFLVVHTALDAAAEGAGAYGSLVPVAVARTDLAPGAVVGAADTEVAALPMSLVPDGALEVEPVGRVVRHPIVAGEAVVLQRLAPEGSVGVAALLAPGERAVAIPLPVHRAPLQVGQLVDVLATTDPGTALGRNPTSVVAEGAVVVAVDDAGITVAAEADDSVRIATALAHAVVSVAVSG
jgi:Flp pilus assembly protein CpaB